MATRGKSKEFFKEKGNNKNVRSIDGSFAIRHAQIQSVVDIHFDTLKDGHVCVSICMAVDSILYPLKWMTTLQC